MEISDNLPILPTVVQYHIIKYILHGTKVGYDEKFKIAQVCWTYHKWVSINIGIKITSNINTGTLKDHMNSKYCPLKRVTKITAFNTSKLEDFDYSYLPTVTDTVYSCGEQNDTKIKLLENMPELKRLFIIGCRYPSQLDAIPVKLTELIFVNCHVISYESLFTKLQHNNCITKLDIPFRLNSNSNSILEFIQASSPVKPFSQLSSFKFSTHKESVKYLPDLLLHLGNRSTFPKLNHIGIEANDEYDTPFGERVFEFLKSNTDIKRVELEDTYDPTIIQKISQMTHITSLSIKLEYSSDYYLKVEYSFPHLMTLKLNIDLFNVGIAGSGTYQILSPNTLVKSLSVNQMCDCVAKLIESNQTIESIPMIKHSPRIVSAIASNKSIVNLCIDMRSHSLVPQAIGQLSQCKTLKQIVMYLNGGYNCTYPIGAIISDFKLVSNRRLYDSQTIIWIR